MYYVDSDEYWDAGVSACFDGGGTPWLAWSDFEYATYSYWIKTAWGQAFENIQVRVPQEGYQVPRLDGTNHCGHGQMEATRRGHGHGA